MSGPARRQKLAGVARVEAAIPAELDTAQAKLCYLGLAVTGPATVDELQAALDLPKLTLLDVLGALAAAGHVERDERGRYATR